jgi:hypothetical protein
MAMLTITCPMTGSRVATGIETDPASVGLIPPVNAPMTCPACGHVHMWSVLEAMLESPEFACAEVTSDWEPQLTRLEGARKVA